MNCKKGTDKICRFIKDTVKDAGAKGVVIGLSGGLDSAVVYKLCVNALGKDKIKPIYMPLNHQIHPHLRKDLRDLTKQDYEDMKGVGVLCHPLIDIQNEIGWDGNDLVDGNITARLRMLCLYSYANADNKLVVGTTNKSEYMIGYFTKYGDGASDFEPIQHLYKTEVFELAKYLKVPKDIIDAKPSADLWEGQTDEGEIGMSYEKLDIILKWLEDGNGIGYSSMPRECGINDLHKVNKMIITSEHKRRLPKCLRSVTNAGK